jgi:hypothetical protein
MACGKPGLDLLVARQTGVKGLKHLAIKKSELYGSLWSNCDALRDGMDASQYKDYVLVMLFVNYVSDS